MKTQKNTAQHQTGRNKSNQTKDIIARFSENIKPIPDTIAVLTKEPRMINGFCTRLLEIKRAAYRLENRGIRHASGAFFKLDRLNFKAAKQFLCSGVI